MKKNAHIFRKKTLIKALLFNKALIKVIIKYLNYSNIFSAKNILKLLKYTKINDYIIKLEEDKQLFFGLNYYLGLMELEILKTYIKINLANYFIWLSKF